MKTLPTEWRSLAVAALSEAVKGFEDWVLCGGHAVALIAGCDTRSHGDTDIGVFRSQIVECLSVLGRERVYLCRNGHVAWDGHEVPPEVHDIWITDAEEKYWVLQIMVFDDDGDEVIYRRDRRLRWSKRSHARTVNGVRVLNPFVTVLFKTDGGRTEANKVHLAEKEIHDLRKLIESWAP